MSIASCDQSIGVFETPEQYSRLRKKLVTYFEGRRCWHADDLADESVARVVAYAASPTARFDGNAGALAFGIARNVLKEWLRKAGSVPSDGETLDALPFPHPDAESSARAERTVAILSADEREFLEEYYVDGSTAEQLAEIWGLSPAGVRSKVFRLRVRLLRYAGQQ